MDMQLVFSDANWVGSPPTTLLLLEESRVMEDQEQAVIFRSSVDFEYRAMAIATYTLV